MIILLVLTLMFVLLLSGLPVSFSLGFLGLSMLIFGGEILHNFALALTIGILFGIYSSIMVGCPMALWLGTNHSNLAGSTPQKKQEMESKWQLTNNLKL